MNILKNPYVIAGLVAVVILGAWYWFRGRYSKYIDFGAMRFVHPSGHRETTDPLYDSVGFFTTSEPKVAKGDVVEIVSSGADGVPHAQGELKVLDVVSEMRPGKPVGYWIATDGWWSNDSTYTGMVAGQYRKV
jgi:hypothetical protein